MGWQYLKHAVTLFTRLYYTLMTDIIVISKGIQIENTQNSWKLHTSLLPSESRCLREGGLLTERALLHDGTAPLSPAHTASKAEKSGAWIWGPSGCVQIYRTACEHGFWSRNAWSWLSTAVGRVWRMKTKGRLDLCPESQRVRKAAELCSGWGLVPPSFWMIR